MDGILAALKIVSESWPIACMVVFFVGGISVTRMVRSANQASVERKNIEAEKELELKRLSFENGAPDVKKELIRRRSPEEY